MNLAKHTDHLANETELIFPVNTSIFDKFEANVDKIIYRNKIDYFKLIKMWNGKRFFLRFNLQSFPTGHFFPGQINDNDDEHHQRLRQSMLLVGIFDHYYKI